MRPGTTPEQDRLRKRFKAMGVVSAHATWGPSAGGREDRAAVINAAMDQIEAGNFDEAADTLPEHMRWKGEGPPPPYWYAADGTKVYRSYEDYCDD